MANHTRALGTLCVSLPLLIFVACREQERKPTPPLPPPEIPQQPVAAPQPTPPPPTEAQNQQQLFATYCVSCHGPSGTGDGPLAASLATKPRNFRAGEFKYDTDKDGKTGTVDDLANIIQNGAARYGGSPLMAGFPTLPKQQVQELAGYVHGLAGQSGGKGG
jgi:mono/diheme cytochrome c family protein